MTTSASNSPGYTERGNIREYFPDYPEDIYSDDIEYIFSLLQTRALHAFSTGFGPNSHVHITFVYDTNKNETDYWHTKTMKKFTLDNLGEFYSNYQKYIDLNLAPTEDYTHKIEKIQITIVKSMSGGCLPVKKDRSVGPGIREIIPRATNNNCFFRCISLLFPEFNASITECDKVRSCFGLEARSMIDYGSAIQILYYIRDQTGKPLSDTIGVYNSLTNENSNPNAQFCIQLKDNHYSLICLDEQKECPTCGERYYVSPGHKHACQKICTLCKTKFKFRHECKKGCPECGKPYSTTHTCNSDRENYFKTRIAKTHKIMLSYPKIVEFQKRTLHYDIETYVNPENEHVPFVLGYVTPNGEYRVEAGEDCMARFLGYLECGASGNELVVNAYNGSNFDHHFLLTEMNKQGIKPDKLTLSSGGIIMLERWEWTKDKEGKLRKTGIKWRVFDLCRHLGCSLARGLKDFGCETQKGSYDHALSRPWTEMDIKSQDSCLLYLKSDVLGLKEMHEKLASYYFQSYKREISDFISTSHMAFDVWKEMMKNTDHIIDLAMSTEEEENIRSSIFGGRCYKSKSDYKSEDYGKDYDQIEDYLINADVVSLYPTGMLNHFPTGHRKKTNTYQRDKLGIYLVSYKTNKSLLHAVVGRKDDKGKTVWDLKDNKGWYTSIDIEEMLTYNYQVTVHEGIYWPTSAKIFEPYILRFFEQKAKSEKGTIQYLSAKLKMNGLYGKMIQRLILELTECIKDADDYWRFNSTHEISELSRIGQNWYANGAPRSELNKKDRINKPCHLGAFILAYTHKIMFDQIINSNPLQDPELDFWYTDTDSLHIHCSQLDKLTNYGGKNLGDMANDDGDGKIVRSIYIAPKLYMTQSLHPNNELKTKFRGKGMETSKLTEQDFDTLLSGGQVENTKDFVIKKTGLKGTNKHSPFILSHQKDFKRIAGKTDYKGRFFTAPNTSYPWFHSSCPSYS